MTAFATGSSVFIFLVILLLALAYWLATLFHWSPSGKSEIKLKKIQDRFEKDCDDVKVRKISKIKKFYV